MIYGIILLVVVGYFAFYYANKQRIKRLLKKTPRKRIHAIRDGEIAQFTGTIEVVGKGLKAPLSGRICGYYHVTVERKIRNGKSTSYETVIDEEKNGFFLIKDGEEYAYIKHGQVLCEVVTDVEFNSGFLDNTNEALEAFLAKHSEKSTNIFGLNKEMIYKEAVLEQGETVIASGKGKWIEATKLGLPKTYGRILQITATPTSEAIISDDPSLLKYDGKTNGSLFEYTNYKHPSHEK